MRCHSESRLRRANRILHTITAIHQVISRERDQANLLRRACEVFVRSGDYAFVWIGLLAEDGQTYRLGAASGPADPAQFTFRLDRPGRGPNCAPAAIRTLAPFRVEPGPDDPCPTCPLRAAIPDRSAIAIPLKRSERVVGAIAIHAPNPSIFDAGEISLLEKLADDLSYALEKLETEEQLLAQARHLSLLNDMTRAALETPDLSAMLQTLAERMAELLEADSCYITLWNSASQTPIPAAASGPMREQYRAMRAQPGKPSFTEAVLRRERAVVVDDVRRATELSQNILALFPVRAGIGLPLIANEEKLGAVFVAFEQPHRFTPGEVERAEQAAAQVALAIARAKSLEAERRQFRLARAQQQVGSLLTTQLSLNEILERILDLLSGVIAYDSASVQLYDEETGQLRLAAGRGFPDPERAGQFARRIPEQVIKARWETSRVVVIPDTRRDARWVAGDNSDYIRSWIGAGLYVKDKFIGALNVDSAAPNAYDEASAETVVAFANQAAIAIEDARLYGELQSKVSEVSRLFAETRRRAAELAVVNSIGQGLAGQRDVYALIELTGEKLRELFDVDYIFIALHDKPASLIRFPYYWELGRRIFSRATLAFGKGLTSRILTSREPQLINSDWVRRADELGAVYDDGIPVKCSIGVPILTGDEAIGVIMLQNARRENLFTDADVRLLTTIAANLGVSIENARLFETLQHREAYFRALVENASDGITVLDGDGAIRYTSPFVEHALGIRPESLTGRNIAEIDLAHPDDQPRIIDAFLRGVARPNYLETVELRLRNAEGEWRHIDLTGHNLLSDPRIGGIVFNYRDITERKRAEEALRRHADELEALVHVASVLRRAPTRGAILPLLIDVTAGLFHADAGALLLREGDDLVLATAYGPIQPLVDRRQPMDESLIWKSALSGQPISWDGIASLNEAALGGLGRELMADMRSCACVPLKTADAVVGLLYLASRERRSPAPEETRLLAAIAEMGGTAIHRATLHERAEHYAAELALAYDSTLEGWARALELRDEVTEGHTRRVTNLTLRLAGALGINDEDVLVHIRRGALLHDIGKMGIPDSILLKPQQLTEPEQLIMRNHPLYAHAMLSPIPFLRPALDIPSYHHEKWDGTGYPFGLKGDQIPLAARIFTVADVWDAITSDRPYRARWSVEQARAYMAEQAGQHFDPQIVEVFLREVLE